MPESTPADQRPSPEALLAEAQKEKRGRLKIFLGAAPGVGKTYEMLLAARKKKADGVDVCVGVVETHGRKETEALLEGLEVLPRKAVDYKGRVLQEMDIDAVLKRRPALVLVDELAHTNAEGSRHPKRYQDVEELLAAGIHVYSTLNIQHIESLNDVVARITHVRVRETVPDDIFDTADDVEIIDLTPDELIQRLQEGKVYAEQQAQRALKNYFKTGNLTALRELALRRTAERVDEQMRQYMRTHAIRGPWAAGERVLVCINESPGAAGLVRAAKRVADRLDADWFAVYFETPRTQQLTPAEHERVAQTLQLAKQLGAETFTLPGGRRIAEDALRFAHDSNITQILVGKSVRSWWFELLHGSVVHDLVKHAGGINVHVLAEEVLNKEAAGGAPETGLAPKHTLRLAPLKLGFQADGSAYGYTVIAVAAATLFGRGIVALVDLPNVSLVYLAAVLWSAARYGLGPSLFASVLSTLCYNFFFIEPVYTFTIADPGQLLALTFFCVAAALTSTLTVRERQFAETAREQARTTAELFAFSRKLAGVRKLDTLLGTTAAQVATMLKVEVMLLTPDSASGALRQMAAVPADAKLDEAELAAATWCWEHTQPTGRGTDTLPGGKRLFLPLRTGQGKVGVIGVSRAAGNFLLTPLERRLLDALGDLAAIAIERIRLAKDVDQARMLAETEKLRSALLTSISHDLRTPLALIIGAVSSLKSYGPLYDEATRTEMLNTAIDEAERLNRYVANLLDMTQLDAGALKPKREPCDLHDLVGAALRRCAKQLAQHKIKVSIPNNLPMLLLDDVLMEQVLANLLDNAAKYTPAGSTIEVGAAHYRFSLVVSVRDEGPGIPEADLQKVFDKFFRAREGGDRGRGGTGLGLAICRGFVEAMGGRIYARNRTDPVGAEFVIEFSPEVIAERPRTEVA
ncbi:MAG: sensor histidine kinase KdpD [Nevskia sp.]|nr:sensor histidine kinase KdpD [Nevskia sp.]